MNKLLIISCLLFWFRVDCLFAQSEKSVYILGKVGAQNDLYLGTAEFGGGLGLGVYSSNSLNRWQGQFNLDYFYLDPEEASEHGFRRLSASIQIGRLWSLKIKEKKILRLGGGLIGLATLTSYKNPWFGGDGAPGGGIYVRAEYPLNSFGDGNFVLVFDNSIFGNGYMRNVLGLAYPFGRKSP